MKYNAFISYRRENGFFMAQVIHDKLLEKGISSFLDLEELRSGKFNEKLYEAIDNSDNFILILPKGSLDRCTSSEDWVRKEILEAIANKKTIIPVLCEGFEWPRDKYSDMPDELRSLENYNAVKATQDYLNAMIERLISFMSGVDEGIIIKEKYEIVSIDKLFGSLENVKSIDMAFHGGEDWFTSIDKADLLYKLIEEDVHIRILLSNSDVSENIAKHMRHERKKYMGFNECINRWKVLETKYPDKIEVRLVDVPLLRCYYSVHMVNQKQDLVYIRYIHILIQDQKKIIMLLFMKIQITLNYIEMNLNFCGIRMWITKEMLV